MPPTGIRFNDCFFVEPVRLVDWTPPRCAGLAVVLTADPNWAPKPFQPLYFGEFGNNTPAHVLLQECARLITATGGRMLAVAVVALPFSTTAQRIALRNELIRAYNPTCQGETSHNPSNEGAQNKAPEAPPVHTRRRIGFIQ